MNAPSFDLIDEPWVRVRLKDGHVDELSLSQVFRRAHEIRALAGELPTQDAAVLRLLLAILVSAVRQPTLRPDAESLALWDDWLKRGLPVDAVTAYLHRHRDRFDLLHRETPFFQVAGLTTQSGKTSGLGKLIADLPDGHLFFTTRSGASTQSLSLAEAARWVVHCQAFDPSGIKSGALGDPRVKGGKGYPFGYAAWAGNLGLVIVEGESLAETLAVNAPLTTSGPDDLPVWERPALTATREPISPGGGVGATDDDRLLRMPHGPVDLFTWPSRRLRLFLDGDRVVDVQISNGDKRAPQDLRPFEPMSGWRVSKNQSKKGQDVFMPTTHDPSRRIWQGLEPLLINADHQQPAAALQTLHTLVFEGCLDPRHRFTLRTVALAYGPQNSTIAGAVDDRITASVAALTEPDLTQTAVNAAKAASQGVVALANLAGDLDTAAGGEGKARDRTFEYGYALLDAPFRVWTLSLDDPAQASAHRDVWCATAHQILLQAAEQLVKDAGPAALVGRRVSVAGSEETRRLDAGRAFRRFTHQLGQHLPRTNQKETDA